MANKEDLTATEREALELIARVHGWLSDIRASGIEESIAISAIFTALIERSLVHWGVDQTADWIRQMASSVERGGLAVLSEIHRYAR